MLRQMYLDGNEQIPLFEISVLTAERWQAVATG
jgi:hypothetical protein